MGLFDIFNVNQITGSFGEWLAKTYAKTMPNALVLNDVLIDGAEGYTSQIDLLLIGNKGIYVVEVKSYADAKIYGDAGRSTWYYYNHGKKYEIYSPIAQNKKHVEYLKRFLEKFGDIPCFSVVTVICKDFKVSGEINKNGEINTVFCNSLLGMEKAILKIAEDKPVAYGDDVKREIYEYIRKNQHIGKEAREQHKQNVIQYKENLEEKKMQKICPYCKSELVLRNGKNGQFYGCSSYPKCRYTMNIK